MAESQDLQESALPKVKSVSHIRGLSSDGDSVSIAKEDLFDSKKIFYLQIGEEVDTGINHAGLICVTANSLTGNSLIGISSVNSVYVSILNESAGSISFVDSPDKVCCFKKDATGTFFIRNNSDYSTPVTIAVL